MDAVIDLTTEPDHEILTTTAASGLLGGEYLSGEPLETYLDGDEPKYVLRNKKSGVSIEGSESGNIEPDSDYQAFALLSDCRITFVAGVNGGDRSETVDYTDIVETRTESGLRTSTLVIETLDGTVWQFPCRGNLTEVASYLDSAAQAWANAARLLDDAEDALGTAQDALTAGEHKRASSQLEGVEEMIDTAIARGQELGSGATRRIGDRGETLRDWLTDARRELLAANGAKAHAVAQEHWENEEYEQAAASYTESLDAYRGAVGTNGDLPPNETLQRRIRAAATERELLRAGPLIDADTSRRRARALADPEDAAVEWEQALDRYRRVLELDWPDDGSFVADRSVLREQTAEIAEDAINDHYEAGRSWLRSGDTLAVQDRTRQAEQVYERAKRQFERAHDLAREVGPENLDRIKPALAAADRRLDGTVPTTDVPADLIGFGSDSEETAAEDGEPAATESTDESDGIEGLSFHDSEMQHTPARGAGSSVTPTGGGRDDDRDSASVLDRIQAQKAGGIEPTTEERNSGGDPVDDQPEQSETVSLDSGDDSDLRAQIESLESAAFVQLIANLWEADGWLTTVVSGTAETLYDIVALDEGSEERLLLWVDHRPGEKVQRPAIERSLTALESSPDAAGAVFVTTASLTPAAQDAVDSTRLTVVETTDLLDRLQSAELTGDEHNSG